MTTHELLTSLLWLVAGSYATYLVWFVTREVKKRLDRTSRRTTAED